MISPKIQDYFDGQAFDPEQGYVDLTGRDAKIRHVHLHVAKAALKLAEGDERIIVDEVLPDTAMYRTQLFNLIGPECFHDFPNSFSSKLTSRVEPRKRDSHTLQTLVVAGGLVATYLERKEHDQPADEGNLIGATLKLHEVALSLGARYAVDVDKAHLRRLESQMGRSIPADINS